MAAFRLPRVEDFSHRLRGPQVTSRVGVWLGVAFGVCFLTGLWSHVQQTTPGWLTIAPSPAWLYRATQGIHIITGTAAVPLLLIKLWSVFPLFFRRPPRAPSRALLVDTLERLSIGVLIAAAIFQLTTGLLNVVQWYPWEFSFRATHYAVAWVAIGALLLHIAVKLPIISSALRGDIDAPVDPETRMPDDDAVRDDDVVPVDGEDADAMVSRRDLVRATGVASLLAMVLTAGQTVPWLRNVSFLAVRSGEGPQGVPINRTAREAGIPEDISGWTLELVWDGTSVSLSRAQLEALPQSDHTLPIACVEGWSASALWSGIPVHDLAAIVGAPQGCVARVQSLQTRGAFGSSELPEQFVADERTLLALTINGETLSADHGFPSRIIAPNRPGVRQTKWVNRMEFVV